jgi:hypothetical protein
MGKMKNKMSDKSLIGDGYARGKLWGKLTSPQNRIMVGIPMTGLLRAEWVLARYGQVIPCNWSQVDSLQFIEQYSPVNYLVADARNLIVQQAVIGNFEWLFFIDHDVIIPPVTFLTLNEYMLSKKYPVVAGLYFTKSVPAEPLIYRGLGNSFYTDWKFGDIVPVTGHGMGCTLIHVSILKAMWDEMPEYQIGNWTCRKIFETPAKQWFDPQTLSWQAGTGTEDLNWCARVMEHEYFIKAKKHGGDWGKFQKKEFPFIIDTRLYCRHIDFDGRQFPMMGEDVKYLRKPK